jgi:hypothetical protein
MVKEYVQRYYETAVAPNDRSREEFRGDEPEKR